MTDLPSNTPAPARQPHPWVYLDGQVVPVAQALVPVTTQAFNYGTAVFEGIRAYVAGNGELNVFRLDDHLKRLANSARLLQLENLPERAELKAIILDLLRRNEASRAEGSGVAATGVLSRGDLVLDETKHTCLWKGQQVQLTVTEFLLVKALATRPGMVKNRDQLIDAAYGENIYVDDRTIDSHVKRVRKKFRVVDPEFSQIETLYGIGYRYKEA